MMNDQNDKNNDKHLERLVIRAYQPDDQQAVLHLYDHGLIKGQLSRNDTAADLDHIEATYFEDEANYFWVAHLDGAAVGMIGVARDEAHTGEIRRLRVAKAMQETDIGHLLIETALTHCRQHDYLKIVFDTRFDTDTAMDLFEKFGFQHTRTKEVEGGKELLTFYLDLYTKPAAENLGEVAE